MLFKIIKTLLLFALFFGSKSILSQKQDSGSDKTILCETVKAGSDCLNAIQDPSHTAEMNENKIYEAQVLICFAQFYNSLDRLTLEREQEIKTSTTQVLKIKSENDYCHETRVDSSYPVCFRAGVKAFKESLQEDMLGIQQTEGCQ